MWRMQDGNRVLTDAEWDVFQTGLDQLRGFIESDISAEADDTDTSVRVFDRLTSEQKLALLADVAAAVRDPNVPMPSHTAANEGAVMAVLVTFRDMLRAEVEAGEADQTSLRQSLLAAASDSADRPDRLPKPTSKRREAWDDLCDSIVMRILWDYDFDMGDEFLDLPRVEARMLLRRAGIDPEYYLAIPTEPDEKGLIAARQTLARLIGLHVPNDDGLYPALMDLYHDVQVGPVTPHEIATWGDNPWIELVELLEPDWDCNFETWQSELGGAVPTTSFRVNPAGPNVSYDLPSGLRVELSDEKWVERDKEGSYWCGLVENCWTEIPDDAMPALAFPTERDAKEAFAQADRMYGERSERHTAALARLGIAE
jgi:hypothetical protein